MPQSREKQASREGSWVLNPSKFIYELTKQLNVLYQAMWIQSPKELMF